MSVNQVHLLGRCGQDPEIRSVGQNNVNKASFSLCTGGKYKTHDGRELDDTAWHNIVAWRGLADLTQRYIRKGTQLFVIGHLSYRKYSDANGIERSITEIIADKIDEQSEEQVAALRSCIKDIANIAKGKEDCDES